MLRFFHIFCVCANIECSGKTAQTYQLTLDFTGYPCDIIVLFSYGLLIRFENTVKPV